MNDDSLTTTALFHILEDRRVEEEQRTVRLHERIDSLKNELYEEIEKSHSEIMDEIRIMRQEMHRHTQSEVEMLDKLDHRVSEIEKWKWYVIGAGATVAFIIFGGLDGISNLLK